MSGLVRRLVGCWSLVSFREQRGDEWLDALGDGARGTIGYWPSGQMSVFIVGRDRPRFRGAWAAIPAEQKAAALDGIVAYSGRYEAAGDRVIHHVENCWIPNWEGRDLVRLVRFDEDGLLSLRTLPAESSRDAPAQEVIWRSAGTLT